ncbi:hypothetical protein M434DRAFT_34930 [Hypoxylon sp. CO27-5]|nr:hypothetical protein M434DRAFT_34930 [Hypoxylon sp. CO27-5]
MTSAWADPSEFQHLSSSNNLWHTLWPRWKHPKLWVSSYPSYLRPGASTKTSRRSPYSVVLYYSILGVDYAILALSEHSNLQPFMQPSQERLQYFQRSSSMSLSSPTEIHRI